MKKCHKNQKAISFIKINLGLIGLAAAFSFLLTPYNLVTGGVGGMGLNLQYFLKNFTDLNITPALGNLIVSSFILAFNVILLTLAYFLVGKDFCLKTLYCALIYPVYVWFFGKIYDWTSFSSLLVIDPTNIGECAVIVLFAAIIGGYSVGISIKYGASTGGVDIIEKIAYVKFHISYSTTLFVVDGSTVVIASILMKNISPILYGVLYIYIFGRIIDAVVFGGFNVCSVNIVTNVPEKVKELIFKNVDRGLTEISACGGYTGQPTKLIVCIMSKNEVGKMRSLICTVDPKAFMYVNRASEVSGLGFTKER